jgi:signal peptide peptidase SppA
MSKKNILLAITNAYWFIDVQSAEQLGQNVFSVLSGKDFWNEKHKASTESLIIETKNESTSGSYFSNSFENAKEGSIAVIDINGPIMKYDNCGDAGSKTFESLVNQANSNPNIKGIVFQISSGGGEVAGTQSLANTIKNVSKPTVTVAEDLMASAAYWIGSSTDYIFANSGTTQIGSIGTMASFKDMRPMWEAQGIKFHEIYATASSEKNKDYADALAGNYDPIIKNILNPLNTEFLNSVKANRKDKINADMTLKGQMYTANDAIKYGLIDAIGNLNDAIVKINELASPDFTQQVKTENQINMKKITLLASHAALLALCGATISAGENSVDVDADDLLNKFNQSLTDSLESKTSLETKVSDLEAKLALAETTASDASSALTTAEAKIRSLENPGTTQTVSQNATESNTTAQAEDIYKTDADVELANRKAKIQSTFK